jgi:hypothetical protein
MKTLTEIQKEWDAVFADKYGAFEFSGIVSAGGQENFLKYLHTRDLAIVEGVKECVPQEHWTNYEYDPEYKKGWNDCRAKLLSSLTGLTK